MDYRSELQKYVTMHSEREAALIEEMCERMLTTPDSPGISVQRIWHGFSWEEPTCTTEVWLNREIPFGTIAYLPDVHNETPRGSSDG